MNLQGARVLVTGGCGLIGSTTVELLLQSASPARVIVLDDLSRGTLENLAAAARDPRLDVVRGDICDESAMDRLMRGTDAVLHLAAIRITACAEDPREAFRVMCQGSFTVVDAARRAGVRKVVAASSASIYGLADRFPTPEDQHPYNDRTWYGAGKQMLEGLLRSYNDMYGLPYVALRYFNVYGPRMDVHGKYTEVLIRWMERLESGRPPLILGDGSQTMDCVYVDDIARANVLALESDVSDEVFNIGSGTETSLKELARLLTRIMGSSVPPEYGAERKVNPVPRRLAATEKAERLLGFTTRVPLDEGLQKLVTWWRTERRTANRNSERNHEPEHAPGSVNLEP